ncbi:SF1B family DNA helicase RecD2 [Bombilactobacillus thymidiniphilus]|uniref:ATP-dependent RecD2 DNA helicase n=1 Tax=Bombilactobacillus thymidiniphilus TaxID=2923363 RepID=A0ABY4PDC6_9LACO|nr:ATP-dependent RecD-like DNA helicase [Bombilactobacillus thymidiniphilus]UQS83773.1 ATP-dependent RecD-like DNA helicase [Bombilactobacillus thymidiniphilus]
MAEEYIIGSLEAIFFEKPEDYFKILLIKVQETSFAWADSEIVVTGVFDELEENQNYRFEGEVVQHPKYGQQFKCLHYQKDSPTDRKGLVDYFASAQFPGIGRKTANKIVDILGNNAISSLVSDATVVEKLPLSKAKRQLIIDQVNESYQTQEIILQLNSLGFGNKIAFKIYHKYGNQTLNTLQTDPYQLIEDIPGIGFKRADQLALNFGLAIDNTKRIQAGLLQTLKVVINAAGNTYASKTELIAPTLKLLNTTKKGTVSDEDVQNALADLIDQELIILDQDCYFPKDLYAAECDIAQQLQLLQKHFKANKYSDQQIKKAIQYTEKQLAITYDDQQVAAIQAGLKNALFLLTGGPGTGKTTIINGLVTAFAYLNDYSLDIDDYQTTPFPVVLAAPTGRAAKHLAASTQLPAGTIHRLLGLTGQEDMQPLDVSEIYGKLLIIDETSMVDTLLFKLLITAIPLGMQVILVGDKDQLPSVGPGQVFSDLIASKVLPTVNLTKIHRQDQDSTIIDLAHDINTGQVGNDFFTNYPDRSFIECTAPQVPHVLQQIILKSQKRGFDLDQVQILAPMYRGIAGIDNLNQTMQVTLNPLESTTKQVIVGNMQYRIGDKVVHLVNNVEKNVFNGEIGTVTGITLAKDNPDKKQGDLLYLDFDGQQIVYSHSDFKNIALAYCTSIHKAQGSEFELVIVVLVRQNTRMLRRNLLYTAVTRAKSKLIMLGDKNAYEHAVADNSGQRQTKLKYQIQSLFKPDSINNLATEDDDPAGYILTLEQIRHLAIDPMIGMANVTPQSFMN